MPATAEQGLREGEGNAFAAAKFLLSDENNRSPLEQTRLFITLNNPATPLFQLSQVHLTLRDTLVVFLMKGEITAEESQAILRPALAAAMI